MLASFLRTGQSVDFALTNAIPDHMPNIELRVYDDTSQRVGSLILMPTEAITLAEHLQQLVEHVATHITQHIQEETSNAERTLERDIGNTTSDVDEVESGVHTNQSFQGTYSDFGRVESNACTAADIRQGSDADRRPLQQDDTRANALIAGTNGQGSGDNAAGVDETPLTSLHPRAAELLAGAGLDDNGNHRAAPAFYNVEIDPSWTAHISEEPVSAALIAKAEANQKRRKEEVDAFVSWLRLVPRKPNNALSDRSYFDVTVNCKDSPWDDTVMPIAVENHPWVRSKAMREVIISAFRQGFQYGINWEESRNEGEL